MMTAVAPRCRGCGERWTTGQVVSSFGDRIEDQVRHYCQPCLDSGAADRVEESLARTRGGGGA